MALDPDNDYLLECDWVWTRFEPSNAIQHYSDGSTKVIPGAWDHDHCRLCQATISLYPGEIPEAFCSEEDDWLCKTCFEQEIQPLLSQKSNEN